MKEMEREAAERALVRLARQSAATWVKVRGEAFLGETTIATDNTIYRFKDGVFSARARGGSAGPGGPAWESPANMQGLELVGFLADEGGLWSLSPRWRPGALAVMWRLGADLHQPFTLTSPTRRCVVDRPASEPAPHGARPAPTLRRPAPPSMTRMNASPAAPASR
jgi:hypothetical protein